MISACIIGLNEADFIALTIRSIRDSVDEIIYVDGGSTDGTQEIVEQEGQGKAKVFYKKWRENWGMQRNYALSRATCDYVFQIDADEVLDDDPYKLRGLTEQAYSNFDVQYVHFIRDFGHIDAAEAIHIGINRLFLRQNTHYVNRMHELATSANFTNKYPGFVTSPKIFHLGYLKGIPSVHAKLKKHQAHSKMHTPEFLKTWHAQHVLGQYPVAEYRGPYPWVIREEYGF